MNSTEVRAAISLACVYVLRMLGLFMVMPVLAVLALDFSDYSPLLLGLAIGGYGLTQALLQIPMGVMSDRWGRKPIILLGLLLFALGSLVAANAESMWMLVIGRFLQGMGAIAGAIMALAADVSRESQRAKVMAVIGISIGFSFYLSLLIGPPLATSYGLSGIFWGTCVLALLCIPLILFAVPSAQHRAPTGDTLPSIVEIKKLFAQSQLVTLNISVFFLHFMITLLFVLVPTYLLDLAMPLEMHWQIYLPVLIASVLSMMILMRLANSVGQKAILSVSILLLATAFLGLGLGVNTLFWLLAVVWLFFAGFNYLEANLPALVSTIAPAGQKGSAMGIYASCQFFGAFCGGLLAGSLNQWLGPESLLFLASVLCIGWLLLLQRLQVEGKMQRYALAIDFSSLEQTEILQRLEQLDGIQDINLIAADNVIYLKVDASKFKLQQAKALFN